MNLFKNTDIAFVTGGGSGIGRATCQLLAEQGATVVAVGLTKKKVDDTVRNLPGSNHLSIQLDVSKKDDVEAAINKVIAKYSSPPTITVNNAAQLLIQPLLELTEETYNKIFDVNIKGTVWVTQAVCKALVEAKKKGNIINVSSTAKVGVANVSVYSATKGALESFSSSVAKEFGPHGIRVNVVAPGGTETPMLSPYLEIITKYREVNPMKRLGTPEEVAEAIVFLASDKASYVNGTSMYVHGGYI